MRRSCEESGVEAMNTDRQAATVNSALWAAYGDALGFMSELVDESGLKRRIGTSRVLRATEWRRRIGGRMGPTVTLPPGCYSDDTELRLATCRSIGVDGRFDVEAFGKIEIVVWPSYALGAGRSTKAAAANLARADVNWFSNFFSKEDLSYLRAGGNGAAMRIQPHVWAAKDLGKPSTFLGDVVRNAICTHGHVRAIAGAVFHACSVAYALGTKSLPGPAEWRHFAEDLVWVPDLIASDDNLAGLWLPTWESRNGTSIPEAFNSVSQEVQEDIRIASDACRGDPEPSYRDIVTTLGGLADASRGSGTKTALFAAILAWLYRNAPAQEALLASANLIGSDTDTIATMAGSIIGCVSDETVRGPLRDRDYIEAEARRLADLSEGKAGKNFEYPDLFSWNPPKSQADAVRTHDEHYWVSGLGSAEALTKPFPTTEAVWQWLRLSFGQTVLIKRRPRPEKMIEMSHGTNPHQITSRPKDDRIGELPLLTAEKVLAVRSHRQNERESEHSNGASLDELTRAAIASNFDPRLIGAHILQLTDVPNGIEKAIAYTSIVAKAKISRSKARR